MNDVQQKKTILAQFRWTEDWADKLTKLMRASRWTAADILRTGVEMHWDEIEAHVLMQAGKTVAITPELRRAIADLTRLGGDPTAALKIAARAHIASLPLPGPANFTMP